MPKKKLPKKIYDLPLRESIAIPLYTETLIYITCNECHQMMKPIGEVEDLMMVEIIIDYQKYMAKEIILECKDCGKTITVRKLN